MTRPKAGNTTGDRHQIGKENKTEAIGDLKVIDFTTQNLCSCQPFGSSFVLSVPGEVMPNGVFV